MNEIPELKAEIPKNRIELERLKNRRGHIGNQGFTAEGVEKILRRINGDFIPDGSSLRELLDAVKGSPSMLDSTKKYLEENPIEISVLPDDSVHLSDGHHRAFIGDQLGMISLPIKSENGFVQAKDASRINKIVKEAPLKSEGEVIDEEYILKSVANDELKKEIIEKQLGIEHEKL